MYWKCTVCNYIHKEAEPPEVCPVCGAAKTRFIPVDADGQPIDTDATPSATEPAPKKGPAPTTPTARWKCTVCNYIHEGPEPPDQCPVCGADKGRFIRLDAEGQPMETAGTPSSTPAPSSEKAVEPAQPSLRRWKCTLCGYIHTGNEPPDKCPVCGADRLKFVEIGDTGAPLDQPPTAVTGTGDRGAGEEPIAAPDAGPPQGQAHRLYDMITDLMVRQHAHPISVHIPNGVAPVGVLFLYLAVLFHSSTLEIAATCNMVVVLLSMPLVIFSGVNDWKKRFGGNMTNVFLVKMICAGVISALLVVLVLWRFFDPGVAASPGLGRLLYLFFHGVLIAAAALAGFMGGKLVFPNS